MGLQKTPKFDNALEACDAIVGEISKSQGAKDIDALRDLIRRIKGLAQAGVKAEEDARDE